MLRDGSRGAREGSVYGSFDAAGVGCGGGPGVLSLRRSDAGELSLLGRDGLVGVLGDIERMVNRLAGYRVEAVGALEALSDSGAAPDATPHLTLRDAAGVSDREARQMLRAADALAYALAGITHTDADAQAVAEFIARTRTRPRPNANNQPNTAPPRKKQPGPTQPRTVQPGPTQPGTTQPGATQPSRTESGATQPGATQPGRENSGIPAPLPARSDEPPDQMRWQPLTSRVGRPKAGKSARANAKRR